LKSASLVKARLYAITDLKRDDPSIFKKADEALKGGADILQLRSKTLLDGEFLVIGRKLREIARRRKKLFIVNDRAHIARLLRADGLHLGQDDLPIREARKIVGPKMIIGKSTHSLRQAIQAIREGADYIGVGPVFKTPTKPGYAQVGLRLVQQVASRIKIPFVAIGGIDETNVRQVVSSGVDCIAVVRAIFDSKNPEKSARHLKEIIRMSLARRPAGPTRQSHPLSF
jgi:thiamine-phosphate pyrophosphorylase